MNLKNIQAIVNSGKTNWEMLLLFEMSKDEKAIPLIMEMLNHEREHKKELITELNFLLSQSDTIIDLPALNKDNFFKKEITTFYEKWKDDVGHLSNENKVIPYSVGLLSASVCADNSLTPEEVEKEFNRVSPSGTTMGWKISEDTHFLQGQTNPCPCDKYPETRKHYLFNC